MTLNEQQQKAFDAWLVARDISAECTACKSPKREPSRFVAFASFDPVSRDLRTHDITPTVQSICSECGHVHLYNARMVGLVS